MIVADENSFSDWFGGAMEPATGPRLQPILFHPPYIRRRESTTVMKSRALVHRKFEDRLRFVRTQGESTPARPPVPSTTGRVSSGGMRDAQSPDHSRHGAKVAMPRARDGDDEQDNSPRSGTRHSSSHGCTCPRKRLVAAGRRPKPFSLHPEGRSDAGFGWQPNRVGARVPVATIQANESQTDGPAILPPTANLNPDNIRGSGRVPIVRLEHTPA